jgi:hypothetical protein
MPKVLSSRKGEKGLGRESLRISEHMICLVFLCFEQSSGDRVSRVVKRGIYDEDMERPNYLAEKVR